MFIKGIIGFFLALTMACAAAPGALLDPEMGIAAGRLMLEKGSPGLAEVAFQSVLSDPSALTVEQKKEATLELAFALIAQDRAQAASTVLSDYDADKTDARYLFAQVLICACENNLQAMQEAAQRCPVERLTAAERALFYFTQGCALESYGELKSAEDAFLRSIACGQNFAQESNRHLTKLACLQGQRRLDQTLLCAAKNDWEQPRGSVNTTAAALYYAALLELAQQKGEAVAVLKKQLIRLGRSDKEQQAQVWCSLMNLEENPQDAITCGTHVLELSAHPVELREALGRLENELISEDPERLRALISPFLELQPASPIAADLYLTRARTYIEQNALDFAQQDAQLVRDHFPNTPAEGRACSLICWIALQRSPPEYRRAAQALSQARKEEPSGPIKAQLTLMEGDLYLAGQDVTLACELYNQLIQDATLPGDVRSKAMAAWVRAQAEALNSKELEAFWAAPSRCALLIGEDFWQAQYLTAQMLSSSGQTEAALQRIAQLQKNPPLIFSPSFARLQLMELSLIAARQQWSDLSAAAKQFATDMEKVPSQALPSAARLEWLGDALFFQALAQLKLGDLSQGISLIATLRSSYPHTPAAALSYLVEADYYANADRLVEAQQRLVELVDTQPHSEYAAAALLQAAHYAQKRGIPVAYEEAFGLLDRILKQYSGADQLAFEARFLQGQILQQLGRFADAQALYEAALYQYAQHPGMGRLLLAKGDCLAAQGSGPLSDKEKLEQAASLYERIFDQSSVGDAARAQAGYKWGKTLESLEKASAAVDVYLSVITRYVHQGNPQPRATSGDKDYWLSRTIFDCAALFESQGKVAQAKELYSLISRYQLPGEKLAQARSV